MKISILGCDHISQTVSVPNVYRYFVKYLDENNLEEVPRHKFICVDWPEFKEYAAVYGTKEHMRVFFNKEQQDV